MKRQSPTHPLIHSHKEFFNAKFECPLFIKEILQLFFCEKNGTLHGWLMGVCWGGGDRGEVGMRRDSFERLSRSMRGERLTSMGNPKCFL
jgi:hypothetical protein